MKNNEADLIALFMRLKDHDDSYQTELSKKVLCAAYPRFVPEDFKLGSMVQVDHFIPQNPDSRDYATGTEIIDSLFEEFLPELPREFRPSQDNIVNLVPLTAAANNRKSNALPGSRLTMFNTLCYHAETYAPHIDALRTISPAAELIAAFGKDAPEITEFLNVIEAVDNAKRDAGNRDHIALRGIDLVGAFSKAATLMNKESLIRTHAAVFEDEKITTNFVLADKLSNRGMKLAPNFTGSVIDLSGNFRERYDLFRVQFLAYARDRLPDILEERRIEREAGLHLDAA